MTPTIKKPAQLPKPYNVGRDIAHLEKVRPLAQAIGIGLEKAAHAEGNLQLPMGTGPRGNPAILRRMSIKTGAPKLTVKLPKITSRLKLPKI